MGPNVRINATSMAPVAIVLARSAMAAFPPLSRSPMIPEPTTAASRKAVPKASATTRRATALLRVRFHGADASAHELVFHLRRDRVHADAFACEKLSCIVDVVDAGRLNVDQVKPRLCEP